jgi:beta-glucanase (GH16 family)
VTVRRRIAAVLLAALAVGCTQSAEAGRKPCRKNCPPPTTTTPPSDAPPVDGDWDLVFTDDFDTLDTSKWALSWFDGHEMNGVATDPANVSVADGNLVLTLSSPIVGALVNTNPNDMKYWSPPGATPFEFSYGYVEARIRFPGDGATIYNWPTWWTTGQLWPDTGEHDIAEGLETLTVNYHSAAGASNQGTVPGVWSNDFHTYGLNRRPGRSDVYYDGTLVKSYGTVDGGALHYLVLNVGRRDATAVYGAGSQVKVDWVRVWTPARE